MLTMLCRLQGLKRSKRVIFLASTRICMDEKKTKKNTKHCHVGLLEITPSNSEKSACSKTEKEMIKNNGKPVKGWEKIKYHTIDETC